MYKKPQRKQVIGDTRIIIPSPSPEEINSKLFESIWKVIKNWDINVTEYYTGYCGGNGSHVKLILDELKTTLREDKINTIIDENML
jgi:hypothetical protein